MRGCREMQDNIKDNIKIVVDNIIVDDTYAHGLWDLARDLANRIFEYGGVALLENIDAFQHTLYDELLNYAKYTHPEHDHNQEWHLLIRDKDGLTVGMTPTVVGANLALVQSFISVAEQFEDVKVCKVYPKKRQELVIWEVAENELNNRSNKRCQHK